MGRHGSCGMGEMQANGTGGIRRKMYGNVERANENQAVSVWLARLLVRLCDCKILRSVSSRRCVVGRAITKQKERWARRQQERRTADGASGSRQEGATQLVQAGKMKAALAVESSCSGSHGVLRRPCRLALPCDR